jgi:hypothetical protein
MGSGCKTPPFLTLALDGGHFTTGKEPWSALIRIIGGPQSWSEHYGEEKNLLLLPGIKPQQGTSSYIILQYGIAIPIITADLWFMMSSPACM